MLWILVVLLWATTVEGATINVSTAAGLTSALSSAVAGDEIVLANGTYTGNFVINGNSGASGNPITLRAANRHQAILEDAAPDCQWSGGHYGLYALRSYWVIKDLRLRQQTWAIRAEGSTSHHITIQDNLIEDY